MRFLFTKPSLQVADNFELENLVGELINKIHLVWEQFSKILHDWSIMYNGVSVVVGPAFDYDFDGHADSMETIKRFEPCIAY